MRPAHAASLPPDDASLVERAKLGDQRAFAELYRRHSSYVAGVVYRLLGDDLDLDDLVQEAFVTASRHLAELADRDRFRAWIAQIAVRRTYKHLARRKRAASLAKDSAPLPGGSTAARSAEMIALYAALDALPHDLRVPWILCRIEGETLPRVAELCEISLATAKRRIGEAEDRLRRRLDAR